jgi:hypothetical protein
MKKNYYQHQPLVAKRDDNLDKLIPQLKNQIGLLTQQVEEYRFK